MIKNQRRVSPDGVGMNKMITTTKTNIDDEYSWNESNDHKTTNSTALVLIGDHEEAVESVRCECCGLSEDCTPTYIRRIKERFDGRWICALCSEAVKEQMKRGAAKHGSKEQALESHMSLCSKYNRTVRLNPKLSLAMAMRDIARKSSERRTMNTAAMPNKTVRATS